MNARHHTRRLVRSRLALAAALALVSVAALGTTGSASTATSSATPLERAAARTGPTIVQLSMQWAGTVYDNRNKQYVSTEPIVVGSNCTGFFVNGQGYIGSAGHCVTYDAGIEAALIEQTALTAIKNGYYKEGTTPEAILAASKTDYQVMTHAEPVVTVYIPAQVSGISTSKSLTARVITSKPFDDGDVALLKVDATNTPALPLAMSANIVIGEHDISIGYPVEVRNSTDASLSPSYKDGTISSQRTVNDGKFKVYETSAAIGHGMSGGPTINEAGEVLGINSFGPIESDAAFNFIRPLRDARRAARVAGRREPRPTSRSTSPDSMPTRRRPQHGARALRQRARRRALPQLRAALPHPGAGAARGKHVPHLPQRPRGRVPPARRRRAPPPP